MNSGHYLDEVPICPHKPEENCSCRKTKIKLLDHHIRKNLFDIDRSFVIGDRETDVQLAENLVFELFNTIHRNELGSDCRKIVGETVTNCGKRPPRFAEVIGQTKETDIKVQIWQMKLV